MTTSPEQRDEKGRPMTYWGGKPEQPNAAPQEAIRVQACRSEDRQMIDTPAGRELLMAAVEAIKADPQDATPIGRYNGLDIEGWYKRAEQAEAQLLDSEPPGSRYLVEIDRLTQDNWRLTQRMEQAEAKAREDATDAAIGRLVREKLVSGNCIQLDRCMILAKEVAAITERGEG